jgi:hypothetical protein
MLPWRTMDAKCFVGESLKSASIKFVDAWWEATYWRWILYREEDGKSSELWYLQERILIASASHWTLPNMCHNSYLIQMWNLWFTVSTKWTAYEHERSHAGKSVSNVLFAGKGSQREEVLWNIKQLIQLILLLKVSFVGKYHQIMKVLWDIRKPTVAKKTLRCPACGKQSLQGANLVRHQTIHSSGGSFKYDVCGKGFSCRTNLVWHI